MMDIEQIMFEAFAVEAAYDLCHDAMDILIEADLARPAYLLKLAIVAILESNMEDPVAV